MIIIIIVLVFNYLGLNVQSIIEKIDFILLIIQCRLFWIHFTKSLMLIYFLFLITNKAIINFFNQFLYFWFINVIYQLYMLNCLIIFFNVQISYLLRLNYLIMDPFVHKDHNFSNYIHSFNLNIYN